MLTTKSLKKSKWEPKTLALTAMLAALVTAATAFIKIPAPFGYAHAGDSMVFLSACVLPAPLGFIAAAIGGAMADVLSGAAVWAIPTAIIKALNVLPFFLARLVLQQRQRDDKILRLPVVLALPVSAAITVGGYYVATLLLYDNAAALAEVPFNIMQSAVGAVLFIALALALDAIKLKQRLGLTTK